MQSLQKCYSTKIPERSSDCYFRTIIKQHLISIGLKIIIWRIKFRFAVTKDILTNEGTVVCGLKEKIKLFFLISAIVLKAEQKFKFYSNENFSVEES